MKKALCILGFILILFTLTACGGNANTDVQSADTPDETENSNVSEYEEVESENEVNYYSVCTNETPETVESFAATVRKQILDKDWESLSENVSYPITVNGNTFRNKSEFASADWDNIMTPEFYKDIEGESCENLFCNSDGIMLGNGSVWIAELLNGTAESNGLKVIAINT